MSEQLSGDACGIPADTPFGRALRAGRSWQGPSRDRIRSLLQETETIAIVGVSPRPDRPSHDVAAALQRTGRYRLFFVNPRAAGTEILGQEVYPDLASLPEVPDMVDVFRRAEDVPPVVEEAVAVGAKSLWVQLGIWNEEAARSAEERGLEVVMDRCLKVDDRSLLG